MGWNLDAVEKLKKESQNPKWEEMIRQIYSEIGYSLSRKSKVEEG